VFLQNIFTMYNRQPTTNEETVDRHHWRSVMWREKRRVVNRQSSVCMRRNGPFSPGTDYRTQHSRFFLNWSSGKCVFNLIIPWDKFRMEGIYADKLWSKSKAWTGVKDLVESNFDFSMVIGFNAIDTKKNYYIEIWPILGTVSSTRISELDYNNWEAIKIVFKIFDMLICTYILVRSRFGVRNSAPRLRYCVIYTSVS